MVTTSFESINPLAGTMLSEMSADPAAMMTLESSSTMVTLFVP